MATLDERVPANSAKPGGQQGRAKRRGSIDVAARMKADIAAVAATQAAAAEGAGGDEGAEVSLEEHFEMLQRASARSLCFRGFEDEELRILAANMAIFHFDTGETRRGKQSRHGRPRGQPEHTCHLGHGWLRLEAAF